MPIHQEEIHLTDLDMASVLEMRGTMRPVLSSIRTTLLCFTDTNDAVLEGTWDSLELELYMQHIGNDMSERAQF